MAVWRRHMCSDKSLEYWLIYEGLKTNLICTLVHCTLYSTVLYNTYCLNMSVSYSTVRYHGHFVYVLQLYSNMDMWDSVESLYWCTVWEEIIGKSLKNYEINLVLHPPPLFILFFETRLVVFGPPLSLHILFSLTLFTWTFYPLSPTP